jgi:hypothetical protein
MRSAQEIAAAGDKSALAASLVWISDRIVAPVKAIRRDVRRRRIRGALKLTGWLDRRRWAPA